MVRRKRDKMAKSKWTADKIRHLREHVYEETQEEFCVRFPVSIDTIRFWEQARGKPSRLAQTILDLLEKSAPELAKAS